MRAALWVEKKVATKAVESAEKMELEKVVSKAGMTAAVWVDVMAKYWVALSVAKKAVKMEVLSAASWADQKVA